MGKKNHAKQNRMRQKENIKRENSTKINAIPEIHKFEGEKM